MDRIFMDEYYEHLRADNIEAFSKERNDEYVGRAEEYKAAKSALLEGLGLEHLFDHSHELTPKEKEIWMLFDIISHHEKLHSDIYLHLQRPPKIERLANFEPIGRCKIPLN